MTSPGDRNGAESGGGGPIAPAGRHRNPTEETGDRTAIVAPGDRTATVAPGDHQTVVAPRQRTDTAVRIVGMIGADRPSRILAESDAGPQYHHAVPPGRRRIRHPALVDAAVCLGFAIVAFLLTHGLWPDPGTRGLALNAADQVQAEWFLSYGAHVYSGDFALVTDRLNAPDGINLLSNASLIVLGIVLGPITLAFGAPVSFAVAVCLNLAATAAGWYLLFTRTLDRHRAAAAIGAALAGFAPGLIAQSNAHLHVAAQWLVPPLVWCVLRLVNAPDRRQFGFAGVLLGLLVTVQYHLGAEVLYLTTLGLGLFGAAYAAAAWSQLRPRLPDLAQGLALAGGLAALLLAYPLWVQFGGPQHVRGGPFPSYHFSMDAAALTGISPLSLAGDRSTARFAADPGEYNAYFGLPLIVVIIGVTVWLWRRPLVIAAAGAAVGALLLALGPQVVVGGTQTGIPGPYALVDALPVISAALPGRLALIATPLFALLLVIAVDTALTMRVRPANAWIPMAVPFAVLGALAPIAPLPLPTTERPPVPRYFTEGYWHGCGGDGVVLVPVPLPEPRRPDGMRWATAANTRFALPEGFFIGPYGGNGQASLGSFPRPTSQLLARVAATGQLPTITDLERGAARDDVAFWNARCLVLAEQPNRAALRSTLDELFGPGQQVADVDVWRVNS